ncbi:MAG TPA: hypothetical protein VEK79_02220 [Thermoanaerobaculia bacterium]|nr:hypothetical protein [Thermoanaerobaculia bacterium]
MKAAASLVLCLIAAPSLGAELLAGVRGATLVIVDTDTGVAFPLMELETNGFGRVVAQDTVRNRLFIETFDAALAPSYFRLWVVSLETGATSQIAFRASARHEYFYDEDADALYVFGYIEGQRQISQIALETGVMSTVLVFPSLGIWADAWQVAGYDPITNRLYVAGVLHPGEFSERALFAADLNAKIVTQSPYRTRQTVRFLPRSYEGHVYAHVAQGVSSEQQQIVRIDFTTGAVQVVIAALPLELVEPIVYSPVSALLYLRRFRDGQMFVADLLHGTYHQIRLRHEDNIEFAPFPVDVHLRSVPMVGSTAKVLLVTILAMTSCILLRVTTNAHAA